MQWVSVWPVLKKLMKTQMTDYDLAGWEIDPLKSDYHPFP